MQGWFGYAVGAAVLYGLHQIFTKLAAERISDGLGGLVVEASASVAILLYLAVLYLSDRWTQTATSVGVLYRSSQGSASAPARSSSFFSSSMEVPCRPCPASWPEARHSWH